MRKPCCSNPRIQNYSIIHSPSPMNLSEKQKNRVFHHLWYAPNLRGSAQSKKSELYSSKLYGDAIFRIFLELAQIEKSDIFLFSTLSETNAAIAQYDKQICVNCPKLIFTSKVDRSDIESFLNHLRNIFAHGRFNMISGLMVGKDIDIKKSNAQNSAFVRIKESALNDALQKTLTLNSVLDVFKYFFRKDGFSIVESELDTDELHIEKAGVEYIVEFKRNISSVRWISTLDMGNNRNMSNSVNHIKFVIVIDYGELTKEIRELLRKSYDIVYDKRDIEKLFGIVTL
jgi:hypothetical protein